MYSPVRLLILLYMIAGLLACEQRVAQDVADVPEQVNVVDAQPTETEKDSEFPFPVYTSFDQLTPWFEKNNDTTYVINFWATWCGPCVKEMPYFEQLHEDTKTEPLKVVLVSLDWPKHLHKVVNFIEERNLKPMVISLIDTRAQDWIDRVDPQWSGAIPITLIYKGSDRLFHEGELDSYQELQDLIEKIR